MNFNGVNYSIQTVNYHGFREVVLNVTEVNFICPWVYFGDDSAATVIACKFMFWKFYSGDSITGLPPSPKEDFKVNVPNLKVKRVVKLPLASTEQLVDM